MAEVGSGQVAIFPTFKGFRSAVTKETDGSAKSAASGFKQVFSKTGAESGKTTGAGFKKAFEGQSTGFANRAVKELETAVASSARAVSAARLKEQDAAGKVRLAERQLAEAREKFAGDTSQVIRAEERLATANRQLDSAQDGTRSSTVRLQDAQQNLARQADRTADELGQAGKKGGRLFTSGFSEFFKGSFFGSFLGNIASNLTSQIGFAIGVGLRKAAEFGIGTIDIASDLNESVNAVNVSYGGVAGAILDLGQTSAKTFGLSKRDLNSYAVQFSAFAKGIAGEGGDVVGTFSSILGRATDFASVMNLEVSEALGLFQSGLAGETEPLRKFGIDLSAAAVEAYALRAGISDGTEELTEAQKQQARYGYLLEQTSAVQGDFANTSDELANKNRINAATWDDLQAKMGDKFLPIAAAVATILSEQVFPAIATLVDEQGPALGQMFEDLVPVFSEFAEDILPKLPELFETIAEAMPLIIDGLSEVLPFLIDFTGKLVLGAQQISDFFTVAGERLELGAQQWGDFFAGVAGWFQTMSDKIVLGQEQVFGFFGAIGDRLALGAEQWGAFFSGVFGWFQSMSDRIALGQSQVFGFFGAIGERLALGAQQWGEFAGAVGRWIGEALKFIGEIPARVTAAVTGAGAWLYNSGKALIQGFIDGIGDMFGAVGDAVGGIMDFAAGFFPNSPAKRGPFSGAGWTKVRTGGGALVEQFQSGMHASTLSVPVSASAGGVLSAKRSYASTGNQMPSELVIVDADRQLIGRMQVEADGRVSAASRTRRTELQSGTRR
jgi:hypothetical protein